MVSNVFVVDQAALAYDIYLIIFVCVGATEADAREHTYNPLKTRDFTPFSKYQVLRSKYLVFQIQSVKNLVFRNFRFEIPSFLIEILGFSVEILDFSFEILRISNICDNRIPQPSAINHIREKASSQIFDKVLDAPFDIINFEHIQVILFTSVQYFDSKARGLFTAVNYFRRQLHCRCSTGF